MKNKVIQICGTNGTGKTTLVKGLLNGGKFKRKELLVGGEPKEWWYDGKIAVIGKYNQANCCGIDAGKYTGEQLLRVIEKIVVGYRPYAVIFEDIRFGSSYTFKKKALGIAEKYGAEYISATLVASLETVSRRVIERTGNESVNFDAVRSKARQVIRSSKKIETEGAKVFFICADNIDKKAVLLKFRGILYG